jgi:colicin import membrane protein
MVLSVAGHGAFMVWALISFAHPRDSLPFDGLPVDLITADDFNTMTRGSETAEKQATSAPIAEKVGEANPTEEPDVKVVENKKEVVASREEATPPAPKEPEPQPKQETKVEEKKEPEQKIDPIAEALKKEEKKKPEKKVEIPKPQPKKPEHKFDQKAIEKLLIDKRDPQRLAAAGDIVNTTRSLGTRTGTSAQISRGWMQGLAGKIRQCWNLPPGTDASNVIVDVQINLRRDGTLEVAPRVMSQLNTPVAQIVARSAQQAIQMCGPYNTLPQAQYDDWKEVVIGFDASWTRM